MDVRCPRCNCGRTYLGSCYLCAGVRYVPTELAAAYRLYGFPDYWGRALECNEVKHIEELRKRYGHTDTRAL